MERKDVNIAWIIQQRQTVGHHGYLEKWLEKPHSQILPYRRLRVSRLLDELSGPEIERAYYILIYAIKSCWSYGRTCSYVLASVLLPREKWNALLSVLEQDKRKLLEVSDESYRDFASRLHDEWKLNGKTDFMLGKNSEEVPMYLYLHNLLGRGNFPLKRSFEEDSRERLYSSVGRKRRDSTTGKMTRESFEELQNGFIRELVKSAAGKITRDQCTLEEFQKTILKKTPAGSSGMKPNKNLIGNFGKPMTLSKRTAVEIFGIENLVLEWDGISSTPFIKYEVGKVRIIYPLDMTSSIMISFVANTLYRALYHNGWSELGKDPGEIYARRKYVVEQMEYLYASSDDGVDFNESHSAADMEDIVRNLVAELRPHLKNEVYQDLVTMAESYCEKIKAKQIKLPSGNQTTPNTY